MAIRQVIIMVLAKIKGHLTTQYFFPLSRYAATPTQDVRHILSHLTRLQT